MLSLFFFVGIGSFSPKGECTADIECAGQLACVNSECVNPCNTLPCGSNAYCEPQNHAAWCRCYPGFAENDRGECVSREFEIICLYVYYNNNKNCSFPWFIFLNI